MDWRMNNGRECRAVNIGSLAVLPLHNREYESRVEERTEEIEGVMKKNLTSFGANE